MRAGTKRLPRPRSTFRSPSESTAPTPIRVSTEERRRRRSPLGFVEALARRLVRRREPTDGFPFRHVFVIAYARSGSARLFDALATIEGFYATGQATDALHGLFFAYESGCRTHAEKAGGSLDEPVATLHDLISPVGPSDVAEAVARAEPAIGAARFDADRYARTLARAYVDTLIQPPARARLIGFHEMRYFDRVDVFDAYVDFLLTAFAPALVVFNKRNPAAVAQSGAWRSYPAETVVADLERFDARASAYAAARPANALVVDYDRYASNPSALRPLFERLGAPFDADALRQILATPLDP